MRTRPDSSGADSCGDPEGRGRCSGGGRRCHGGRGHRPVRGWGAGPLGWDRRRCQQRRAVSGDGFRNHDRRRPRCRPPAQGCCCGEAHSGYGSAFACRRRRLDRERTQYRGEGSSRRLDADVGFALRRDGADQGAVQGVGSGQHTGERRAHRPRPKRAVGPAREASNLPLEEFYERMAAGSAIPLGRIAEASEFADLAAFLVSPRASYVSGTAINFDGGMSAVV